VNRIRSLNVEYLLWLALVLALSGSLKHLASVFASVDGNTFLGWLQAVAIDAGVFALAYQIRIRRKEQRNTKRLWVGVVTFTTISVYGNLAYGLQAVNDALPGWIQVSKPYVLAATLPLLVLFLAELLGDDREYAKEQAQPVRKTSATAKAKPDSGATKKPGGATADTRAQAAKLLTAQPKMTGAELARQLNISGAYGRKLRNELQPESTATNGTGAQL